MDEKRAVCLNCMDGRTQLPIIDWIKNNKNADYVDMITEPGMDGLLADSNHSIDGIKRKIQISIDKNNAQDIFIVGHYDCKGNPVDEATHKGHVQLAVDRIKNEFPNNSVVGLWVDNEWQVNKT